MHLVLPRAAASSHRWTQAAIGVVFVVVATGIALVRFRCSPLYPTLNDVNSDVYVYQVVGNSWAHGLLPYRDVYDVKGPFLYLLFKLFAWLRPWSMGPPLAALVLLTFGSLWLAYAVARHYLQGRALAAVAAAVSCLLIYLSAATVPTSFTCEELAVPGVLLLLWLVTRWLNEPDRDGVANAWWVLDGIVFGALFWSKYQVIAPWVAMLVALAVIVVRGGLAARSLGRVVVLHLAGAVIATAAILIFYVPDLPDMLRAYFLAKRSNLDPAHELLAEADFASIMLTHDTASTLALLGVLVLLFIRTVRRASPDGLPLTVAFCLSLWTSAALVRHPNNLFVPLSFCAVAVPQVLFAAQSRGPAAARAAGAGMMALAAAACVAPLAQGVATYGLLRHPEPLTCYRIASLARTRSNVRVSTLFANTAGNRPILSVGTLFAARSSYVSHQPVRHPLEFVDASWSRNIGADGVQAHYLQDRTFKYAWIHISGVDPFHDLEAQIAAASYTDGPSQPDQAAALTRNYIPVLACNNEILLRAR